MVWEQSAEAMNPSLYLAKQREPPGALLEDS